MKKVFLTSVICLVLLILVTGCGSNSTTQSEGTGSNSNSVTTLYVEDLYNNEDQEELLEKYEGKKVSLVGTLDSNDISSISYKGFTLVCIGADSDDAASLGFSKGDTVTMTGTLSDFGSVVNSWTLNDCTVTK